MERLDHNILFWSLIKETGELKIYVSHITVS